jgi:integrase
MGRPRKPYFRESDQCWVSRFNGQYVKLARGRENKTAALRKCHELHLDENPPRAESASHTVASIIDLYVTHARTRCSADTLAQRLYYLQAFAETHGWRKVNDRDCLPYHLTSWLDAHPAWKSDWTLAHAINVVQRPFNWAVKQRLIPANPFRGVRHGAGQPRRPLTDQEFQALLRATSVWEKRKRYKNPRPSDRKRRQRPSAGARFRELLIFLRYTGARPGEASRLEWTDIDLDSAVISLAEHKTSRTQKVKKPRVIPLHPVVVKLLIHVRRRQDPGNRVFLTHRKTPWNRANLSLRMRRSRAVAGIPGDAKLYGLRHGFGTRSIVNGVDIKTLAELMGHTTTRMTEHYLHLAGQRQHLADAMRRANARRPGS